MRQHPATPQTVDSGQKSFVSQETGDKFRILGPTQADNCSGRSFIYYSSFHPDFPGTRGQKVHFFLTNFELARISGVSDSLNWRYHEPYILKLIG